MLETLILSQTANLIFDPVIASDDQDKIIFVNLAYSNLTGWREEEVLRKDKSLFYAFPEKSKFESNKRSSLQEGTLLGKNGGKLFLKGTSSLLIHPSVPDLALGQLVVFHTNVSNDYDNYNSADDFVSTVSHELRTPLTSIKGFAETLIRSAPKIDPSKQTYFLKIIKDRSEHLARLVEDLLLVSRLHNNRVHLIIRELNIKKYIKKVCKSLENQLETKKFSYQFPREEIFVMADSDRLEQILTNLISNAIKYSSQNTEIEISVETTASRTIRTLISNKGEAIPEKSQKSIFDRFSRIDNPLTRKTSGTGLGLYISRWLANTMKGRLLLEKSDQEATTFSFSLPGKSS